MLSQSHTATSVKSIPSVTYPEVAVSYLTSKAHTSSTSTLQAVYYAGVEHEIADQSFLDIISLANIFEAVNAAAHQYMHCTPSEDRIILLLLSTKSSLPEYMTHKHHDFVTQNML